MAFRSVRIRLFNMTSNTLTLTFTHLDHGIFTDQWFPPLTIAPDQLAQWRGESGGGDIPIIGNIGTGTEGNVDYKVDGLGDLIRFHWDNPAVGNTFFGFEATDAIGGPSDLTFFTLHFAFDGSAEPPPGQLQPLFAVSQGDLDGSGLIIPFPGQKEIKPHAWFDIGLRNKREPLNVRRWLKALGADPSQGLKVLFPGRSVDLKELAELPINH